MPVTTSPTEPPYSCRWWRCALCSAPGVRPARSATTGRPSSPRWGTLPLSPRSPSGSARRNPCAIAAVTVVIVVESIRRLQDPQAVHAGTVVIIAAVAMMANGLAVLLLRDGTNDLNMRSAVLHMAGDALGSAAVLLSGVVLLFVPSATWLDPVSALGVAAIIR